MAVAVQSILAGMPEPADLHRTEHDGHTVLTVGSRVLAAFDSTDTGMRNITIMTLTELGFTGRRVAEVLEVTPEHVSTVRSRARLVGPGFSGQAFSGLNHAARCPFRYSL